MRIFKLVKFYIFASLIIASILPVQAMEEEHEDHHSKLTFKEKMAWMEYLRYGAIYSSGEYLHYGRISQCYGAIYTSGYYDWFTAPGASPKEKLDEDVMNSLKLVIGELKQNLEKPNLGLQPLNKNPQPLVKKPEDGKKEFMEELKETLMKKRKEREEAEDFEENDSVFFENRELLEIEEVEDFEENDSVFFKNY
jgi:hypothetical protein